MDSASLNLYNTTVVNNLLYFTVYKNGIKLYRTDGTSSGTIQVGSFSSPKLKALNSTVYIYDKGQLWKSDRTHQGTSRVNFTEPFTDINFSEFTSFKNYVFFPAKHSQHGVGLWKFQDSLKQLQTITFEDIPEKEIEDSIFYLNAVSNSGLPINFISSDTSIISIVENKAIIHKGGEVFISAIQRGNQEYYAAPAVFKKVSIKKLPQTIFFEDIGEKVFTDRSFKLNATSSASLSTRFLSSNPEIITINEDSAFIIKAGEATITAYSDGNGFYEKAASQQLVVVNKGTQTITFDQLLDHPLDKKQLKLLGLSSSGLHVEYHTSNPEIAGIKDDTLIFNSIGEAEITATQKGNENYMEAAPVKRMVNITAVTGLKGKIYPLFFPNPTSGIVTFLNLSLTENIQITDCVGKKIYNYKLTSSNSVDLSGLPAGIYFINLRGSNYNRMIKIIKN